MAGEVPKTVSLKLFVDKENKRVIFAEADRHFVDVLFSFLTLPVGTVTRLFSKQSQKLELGCMHNLYKSVQDLEGEYFWDDICKTMLLHTRNSSADICRKLKVNLDDTEPIKFYMCPSFSASHVCAGMLSTFCDARCGCGGKLTKEVSFTPSSATVDRGNEVFLKAGVSFLITDDLQVMPLSLETTFGLLNNSGVRAEALEAKTIDVSHEEVSRLLKHMLTSEASLTETFLLDQREVSNKPRSEMIPMISSAKKEEIGDFQKINLNVILQKSSHKIICAEAGHDFVNLLMSILTVPLGAVVKHPDVAATLRSISTLYNSVEGLTDDKHMTSGHHKELLISPKLALQYACKYQLLDIVEATFPPYFYNYCYDRFYSTSTTSLTTTKLHSSSLTTTSLTSEYSREMELFKIGGFVRGPTTFMVTDDLVVTPLSFMSTITLLQQLKVPIDDVEKQVLSIGYTEAKQILGAAMTSKTALTAVLGSIARKNPKQERP